MPKVLSEMVPQIIRAFVVVKSQLIMPMPSITMKPNMPSFKASISVSFVSTSVKLNMLFSVISQESIECDIVLVK